MIETERNRILCLGANQHVWGGVAVDIPANLDTDLPFFAYGAFRPGELAFLRLKSYRPVTQEDSVRGRLLVRDGLPVLDLRQRSAYEIPGAVLTFVPNTRWNAYMTICELEPQSQ
jgi:hypothetical protein